MAAAIAIASMGAFERPATSAFIKSQVNTWNFEGYLRRIIYENTKKEFLKFNSKNYFRMHMLENNIFYIIYTIITESKNN